MYPRLLRTAPSLEGAGAHPACALREGSQGLVRVPGVCSEQREGKGESSVCSETSFSTSAEADPPCPTSGPAPPPSTTLDTSLLGDPWSRVDYLSPDSARTPDLPASIFASLTHPVWTRSGFWRRLRTGSQREGSTPEAASSTQPCSLLQAAALGTLCPTGWIKGTGSRPGKR